MAAFEEDTFERLWGGVAARTSCFVFEGGYVVSYFKRSVNSLKRKACIGRRISLFRHPFHMEWSVMECSFIVFIESRIWFNNTTFLGLRGRFRLEIKA